LGRNSNLFGVFRLNVEIATYIERANVLHEWNEHVMFKKVGNDKEAYNLMPSFCGSAS
jgi:hypothetical protein